ncbi:DUF6504 family protein [Sphingomonas immobilis]|uniref:DNA polymerase Y family protein n=1 Tax=Sphingomonas immobilis TaxID=3063997 RepID=A0ABT8ZWT0_9SPHN|nr:DUF6504 family protein [Sphingomonas sp. CA1-15]MDO7841594.1 DNA polymerase Y family protein [Sphingomonas sp. CA1-15]
MKRVASLYLPDWPIERLRRAERTNAKQPDTVQASLDPLLKAAAAEQAVACSVPRGGGWRPGARWARTDGSGAAMPDPRQTPHRDIGRRDEAAKPPFRAMRPDEAYSSRARGEGSRASSARGGGETPQADRSRHVPSTIRYADGPPPRAGEEYPPFVTSLKDGSRLIIGAACPAAQALGLVPAMPITQARALVPGLDIRPADREGDQTDLTRLAITAARRWAPIVAFSGPDGLFLDVTGTAHLFGGEARMARRIVRLMARLGFTARVAVADTTGAAWAMARYGRDALTIVAPAAHIDALAPLPLAALRLDSRAVDALLHLGVDSVGQLAAMPRAPLVRRFGGAIALRLDQASGRVAEPLDPVVPAEPIAAVQRFAEPIATAEAIEHWLGQLMPRLVTALADAGKGVRAIELVADRIDGVPQRLTIGLARPSRDGPHMLRLITRRIEEIAPGYGIDALALHVRRADPLGAQPFEERLEDKPTDIAPLVDALANRIGEKRLWRMRPVESDVPERSLAPAPPLDPPPRPDQRLKADDVRRLSRTEAPHPWHPRWPRPARLLRRPELLDHVIAELPDQPPRRFDWRGETHRVIRADGPERILGEWWLRTSEAQSVRDYFRVEDEAGRRFWLFRRGDGERPETGDLAWFIHGAFG